MPVIRELFRVFGGILRYSAHRRSIGLFAFFAIGMALVLVVIGATFAAPVLLYPLL